jgi:hypothetical protein
VLVLVLVLVRVMARHQAAAAWEVAVLPQGRAPMWRSQ